MNLTPDISKKDQIAQYIRGRIRNNYYPAGKRLESVRRLADEFNVSLKIVTDALADLEMEGLVRREAGRGVFAEQGRRLLFVFIGGDIRRGWRRGQRSVGFRWIDCRWHLSGAMREETLPGSSAVIISVLFSMVIICEAMNPKSPFSAKRACP